MKRVNEIERKLVFTDGKWKFAQIVRPDEIKELVTLLNNFNEQNNLYRETLTEIYKVSDSFEWHYFKKKTPENYINSIVRKSLEDSHEGQ